MIAAGSPSIDFDLQDENGNTIRLSSYLGKVVVLYFYPKDDTPGCTTEACNFRDSYSIFKKYDVVLMGVSPDSSKSHLKFKEKYTLPFTLLADEKHEVCDKYGVWGDKKLMGREYKGVLRTTFVIDQDGKIAAIFENVQPATHSSEIIEIIQKIKKEE